MLTTQLRRKVRQSNLRLGKAGKHSTKLTRLGATKKASGRASRASVFTAAKWGHQAQGLDPKGLNFLRQLMVQQSSRHRVGSIDAVFDTQELGTTDPVCEHWACLAKVLNFKGPVEDRSPSVWSANWQALNRRKEPWRVVAGSLSATRAYLLDLRVDGNSLGQWSVGNRGVKVRDGEANSPCQNLS